MMLSTRLLRAALLLLCALAIPTVGYTQQPKKVDIDALIKDTQRSTAGAHELGLIWWMPEAYWRVIFTQGQSLTAEGVEEMLKPLRPYTIVAVARGKIGPIGGVTYMPEAEIRKSIVLTDTAGNEYHPIEESAINPDAKNFLAMLKPALANTIGPMGESFFFFSFPARNASDKPVADPLSEGELKIKIGEEIYEWHLPLGSLLQARMCPRDKEILSGAWTYCPWHGDKLVPAPGN